MFFYHGKTFHSSQAGGVVVGVECERCGCQFYYRLARVGTSASTAPYGIGQAGALRRADEQAEAELRRRLATEAELVPCPACHWINDELVDGYRRSRYRSLKTVATVLGVAGTLLSLVVAWFLSVGPLVDRWLIPYFLVGGPILSVSAAAGLLAFREWLRRLIQPNRDFPLEPALPLGSPPAMLYDEATETLNVAKPTPAGDAVLMFQFGRHSLPNVCCSCLRPADGDGYTVDVTNTLSLAVPLCAECGARINRVFWRTSVRVTAVAILASAPPLYAIYALADVVVFVVGVGFAIGGACLLGSVTGTRRSAPVTVAAKDPTRGVVSLRLGNPEYVARVAPALDGGSHG